MRPTYFQFFLFQSNSNYPMPLRTMGALAAFTQSEDAAVLAKKLRKTYSGLSFPIFRLEDFDAEGNLIEGATEYEID